MVKRATHECTVTLGFGVLGELDLQVVYRYSPGTPDVWYLPNGDPGYPGDPAELEILHCWITFPHQTEAIDLREAVEDNDSLQQQVIDQHEEDGE